MTPRQEAVFRSVIREYVRTGEPVGSATLRARSKFPWSPATIRAEFSALEEEEYLEHPHTSAGRMPTTIGFRYYVDHCMERSPEHKVEEVFRRVADDEGGTHLTRSLAHTLAQLTGTFAVVALEETSVHEAGLGNVLRMREWAEARAAEDLERLVDALLDHAEELNHIPSAGPSVFINGENPLAESRCTSMVISRVRIPSGETLVAALLGPIRMPYERHWRVLRSLEEVLSP